MRGLEGLGALGSAVACASVALPLGPGAVLTSLLLSLVPAGPGWAQSAGGAMEGTVTEAPLRTTLGGKRERLALSRAIAGALRRLERPSCQKVFSDFKDASGRPLQERLDALGQTGASFMEWILFEDGRGARRCANRDVLALTMPGSRAVWICGKQFSHTIEIDPGLAEAVLIHEVLHALGLGEDPPTSEAITRNVIARCGS